MYVEVNLCQKLLLLHQLKVSKSQMQIRLSLILPKSERNTLRIVLWAWNFHVLNWYSCNKIITTQNQIFRQNWNALFSNISNHFIIQLTPIVSRAKSKWHKSKKVKKLASNSQLRTVQILTNDVQVLILCLSYFISTVIQCLSVV